tara:strand:+ start:107 stop:382 length:276 start_codon:yes stop_codon:yes gene_type:complete
MPTVTMTLEEYEALMDLVRSTGGSTSLMTSAPVDVPEPKPKKRKRSKYNRELSKQLEKMKKKHPRTKQSALMSKAHAATRKVLGLPKRRKK